MVDESLANIEPSPTSGFDTQFVAAISITLLLYDYCLTFVREVDWIWLAPNKFTFTVVLYSLNRYLVVFSVPVTVLLYFGSADVNRLETCISLNRYHHYVILVSQAIVGIILIVRAYALYSKNRWVLAGTCGIMFTAAALGVWSIISPPQAQEHYLPQHLLPRGTCILPTTLGSVERYMSSIIVAMVLEVVIFVLILCKSVRHIQAKSPLLLTLLRDGTFYFALVMLANMGVILSYYLSKEDYSRGNVATFASCLNSALVCRLILNLRDPSLRFQYRSQHRTEDILTTVDVLTTVVISRMPSDSMESQVESQEDSRWTKESYV